MMLKKMTDQAPLLGSMRALIGCNRTQLGCWPDWEQYTPSRDLYNQRLGFCNVSSTQFLNPYQELIF
jgi:hypothetical protein